MEHKELITEIADIYSRLKETFKSDDLILIGGTVLLLTCDPNRKFGDLDVLVPLDKVENLSERDAAANGFDVGMEDGETSTLTDKKTKFEIEVTGKTCKNLNKIIGVPLPTRDNPTAMGLPVKDITNNAIAINVNGTLIKIPNRAQQILMKFNLWRFRGKQQIEQKDADDIRRLIKFYYGSAERFIHDEQETIIKYKVYMGERFEKQIQHISGEKIRHTSKAGSHILMLRNGKLLMLKRFGGYGSGQYALVAGHLDEDETLKETAVREAKEEVGVDISKDDLSLLHIMHRTENGEARIILFWKAAKWNGEPKNIEPDKCSELKWVDSESLPDNTLPFVRYALEKVSKNELYSEYGWR